MNTVHNTTLMEPIRQFTGYYKISQYISYNTGNMGYEKERNSKVVKIMRKMRKRIVIIHVQTLYLKISI